MTSSEVGGTFEITYTILSHILFIVMSGGSKVNLIKQIFHLNLLTLKLGF